MRPVDFAQSKNGLQLARWWTRWVACQRSRVGLVAAAQSQIGFTEPGQELGGPHDLSAGVAAAARGQWSAFGPRPQPGLDLPGGELFHDPAMMAVADRGEVTGQPALEEQQLLVNDQQQAAAHQQFAQVRGRAPGLEFVEGRCVSRGSSRRRGRRGSV
ncbi:hypothetical protein [Nocardia sp. R7R-8]|uniref:hypothetical protein n=1 Tax=Nocardia sp. R7R-8 TaxID=3459304 RepID=UPI00403D7E42